MTVKETFKTLTNNGHKRVFDDSKGMYLELQKNWDKEVKEVTYHNGYGYAQVNAVMHV